MKAIYINLDPYLAAFAAWLKGGKSGPPPAFDPLPLAVTIPLGESAAVLCPGGTNTLQCNFEIPGAPYGTQVFASASGDYDTTTGDWIESNFAAGYSAYPPGEDLTQYYGVHAVSSNSVTIPIDFYDGDENKIATIPFTVLVRRETASGPVDLVDFTPPAAAIAAGTDLKGTKFNGNEIVAAAGTGALSAPAGS